MPLPRVRFTVRRLIVAISLATVVTDNLPNPSSDVPGVGDCLDRMPMVLYEPSMA
jgi:hypothetical protein